MIVNREGIEMSARFVWVFRRPGPDSGKPMSPISEDQIRDILPNIIRELGNGQQELIRYAKVAGQYSTCEQFVFMELFERNMLRQGWGVPGLDLRRDRLTTWVPNFVVAGWKYWGDGRLTELAKEARSSSIDPRRKIDVYAKALTPLCSEANGRFGVLFNMVRMEKGHVVFIPRTDGHGDHWRSFSVATVSKSYCFEDMANQPNWLKNFGHKLEVGKIKSYRYSEDALLAIDFRPYQRAVNMVTSEHDLFRKFISFLEQCY